jgi:hypothetical protein
VKGLRTYPAAPSLTASLDFGFAALGGDHHYRDLPPLRRSLNGSKKLKAVHFGHVDVAQHQIDLLGASTASASWPSPASWMVWIAMPVCRSTRCRIFRIAAESSTTKTSIPFDSLQSIHRNQTGFSLAGSEKVSRESRVAMRRELPDFAGANSADMRPGARV